MPNELDPLEDQWYAYLDKGQRFYIVAIDEDNSTVEVQHFDGDLEELTLDEWRELNIRLSEAPENWDGPLDVGEQDDLGTGITDTNEEDWQEPQQDFRPSDQEKLIPEGEISADEYSEGYKESAITASENAMTGSFVKRPDGKYEESLGEIWVAEYAENYETGLWEVEVLKHDVPEWHDIGYASLEDAQQAAHEYYDQV
jgi:hypothetical protein